MVTEAKVKQTEQDLLAMTLSVLSASQKIGDAKRLLESAEDELTELRRQLLFSKEETTKRGAKKNSASKGNTRSKVEGKV